MIRRFSGFEKSRAQLRVERSRGLSAYSSDMAAKYITSKLGIILSTSCPSESPESLYLNIFLHFPRIPIVLSPSGVGRRNPVGHCPVQSAPRTGDRAIG